MPLPIPSEALRTLLTSDSPPHLAWAPRLGKLSPPYGEWREEPALSKYLFFGALVIIELIASLLMHPALS